MSDPDYDDPRVEEQWCAAMRDQVAHYLTTQQLAHGRIGEWPAWHVVPLASIWAIESRVKPGWVGMWVICGDLPSDYVVADRIGHPRAAMQAFADRWRECAADARAGVGSPGIEIRGIDESPEMIPMLESRAAIFAAWAGDDSMWERL